MKLLADEGVDKPIVDALRAAGHQVGYIAEMEPGLSDKEVLTRASQIGALLVTADKDFGTLVFQMQQCNSTPKGSFCCILSASRLKTKCAVSFGLSKTMAIRCPTLLQLSPPRRFAFAPLHNKAIGLADARLLGQHLTGTSC